MVAVGVLAAATEYACGLLVLAAFFPWRIRGKLRSAAAPFICGLVHILFSVLTTAWPLLSEGNSHIGKFLSCEQRLVFKAIGEKDF